LAGSTVEPIVTSFFNSFKIDSVSAGDTTAARDPPASALAAGALEGMAPVALHADAARSTPAASNAARTFEKSILNLVGQLRC
jgi:hypothetical protein